LLIGVSEDLEGLFSVCFLVGVFSFFFVFLGVGFVVVCGSFLFVSWAVLCPFGSGFVLRGCLYRYFLVFSGLAIVLGGFLSARSAVRFPCSRRWRDIFSPFFCSRFQRNMFLIFRGLQVVFCVGFRSSCRIFIFLFPPLAGFFPPFLFPLSAGYIFDF
jgi:hypothetical protein